MSATPNREHCGNLSYRIHEDIDWCPICGALRVNEDRWMAPRRTANFNTYRISDQGEGVVFSGIPSLTVAESKAASVTAKPTVSIALVGCSGPKLKDAAPARQLYTSQLFRSTLALAEARHDVVYVISAKHELVALDQVIEPYNRVMSDIAKEWRAIWGTRVWDSVQRRHLNVDRQVFIYAGKDYARPIQRAGLHRATFHEPLAKMQIGERLKWLREQLGARENDTGGSP